MQNTKRIAGLVLAMLLPLLSSSIALGAPEVVAKKTPTFSVSFSALAINTPALPLVTVPTPTSFGPEIEEVSTVDFFSQVLDVIKKIGGVSTLLKISLIITLIVSSMKVSFLNAWIWSKLGPWKVWSAPVLALIAGVLGLGAGGAAITPALVFAYLTAGAGSVFMHEILDSLKAMPGLGKVYLAAIAIIESTLSKDGVSKV